MRSAAQSHWRYRREALAAFGSDWETSGEPQAPDPLGNLDDDLRPLTLGRVREIVAAARREVEESGATRWDGWQSADFAAATIEPGSWSRFHAAAHFLPGWLRENLTGDWHATREWPRISVAVQRRADLRAVERFVPERLDRLFRVEIAVPETRATGSPGWLACGHAEIRERIMKEWAPLNAGRGEVFVPPEEDYADSRLDPRTGKRLTTVRAYCLRPEAAALLRVAFL